MGKKRSIKKAGIEKPAEGPAKRAGAGFSSTKTKQRNKTQTAASKAKRAGLSRADKVHVLVGHGVCIPKKDGVPVRALQAATAGEALTNLDLNKAGLLPIPPPPLNTVVLSPLWAETG